MWLAKAQKVDLVQMLCQKENIEDKDCQEQIVQPQEDMVQEDKDQ